MASPPASGGAAPVPPRSARPSRRATGPPGRAAATRRSRRAGATARFLPPGLPPLPLRTRPAPHRRGPAPPLLPPPDLRPPARPPPMRPAPALRRADRGRRGSAGAAGRRGENRHGGAAADRRPPRPRNRKSGVEGQRVSVPVALGGRGIIKKKKNKIIDQQLNITMRRYQ